MTAPATAAMAQTAAIVATSTIVVSWEASVLDASSVTATAEPTIESDVATVAMAKFDVLMDCFLEFVDFGEPGCKLTIGPPYGCPQDNRKLSLHQEIAADLSKLWHIFGIGLIPATTRWATG